MQKSFLPLVLVLAVSFSPPNTWAQTAESALQQADHSDAATGPLSLNRALELALRANPDLAVAAREIEALEGAVRQAGIVPNPEIVALVEDRNKATRSTTLQLNQPLELGGKRAARIDAAQRTRDVATAELNAKRADIRATVMAAFYDTLAAQERHRLAQASVELAQRATTAASKRVTAGKVSPVEETKARVAESGIRVEMAQAKSELANARRRLAATWGSATPRFERAEGQAEVLPPIPALDELMQRLPHAPMLVRSQLEVERRQALAQVERSRRIPDVTVSLGVKRNEELGRDQALFGVSIPLPLFDRNQGNLQEALSRTDKARDERIATEVRLSTELATAHERLTATHQEAELLQKEILPGAHSAYDAATKGFELGKFSFLDVLDAQRTLFQAKSQYLRALVETYRTRAEIERIVGAGEQKE